MLTFLVGFISRLIFSSVLHVLPKFLGGGYTALIIMLSRDGPLEMALGYIVVEGAYVNGGVKTYQKAV